MYIAISKGKYTKVEWEYLLIKTTKNFLKLSYEIVNFIFYSLIEIGQSYKEFSPANIRKVGLGEILFSRALRFFNLEEEILKKKRAIKKKKRIFHQKRKSKKYPKGRRKLLLPLYFLIIYLIERRKRLNKRDGRHFVNKNTYTQQTTV